MKRRFKIFSLIMAMLLLLVGCSVAPSNNNSSDSGSDKSSSGGGDKSSSSDQLSWNNDKDLSGETITILWTDTDGANGPRAKLLKQFTKETGIKVNELGVDYNSLYEKITQSALSNSSDIDVAEMDTIWAGQFLKGQIAEDLTDIVPDDVKNGFTKSSLSSVTYDGHLVAVPYFSSTKHFYWNKKLLKEAGYDAPPKTWDEFQDMSKKLTEKGVYASGWSWKQAESLNCDYVSLVYAFGGEFFDQDGKPAFNQGGGLKALQFMVDILKKDKTVNPASLQWTEDDVMNSFAAGKLAMMSNWEGAYPRLNTPSESSVVDQTDVGLMPGEGDVVSSAVTGSEGLALMKSSKHKQAALAFLKWMGGQEFQTTLFKTDGSFPSLQSAYSDPGVKEADKTNTLEKYQEQFAYGHNRPNAPGYVKWADILSADLHDALLGKASPKDALDKAATDISKAIEEAK